MITISKATKKETHAFNDREWHLIDNTHYGRRVEWNEKKFRFKVEEFGKKLGAHKIWLITGKNWSENAFYKKLGFKLIGNLSDFYFHKNFVIYTRPIK